MEESAGRDAIPRTKGERSFSRSMMLISASWPNMTNFNFLQTINPPASTSCFISTRHVILFERKLEHWQTVHSWVARIKLSVWRRMDHENPLIQREQSTIYRREKHCSLNDISSRAH